MFQLGNTSYRIIRIEPGRVRVEDAQGQPPNIPFWLGEAPGRSDELSASVARLRDTLDELLGEGQALPEGQRLEPAIAWLGATLGWTMMPRGRSSSTWPAPARPWGLPGAGGW